VAEGLLQLQTVQYGQNIQLNLQQMRSRLRGKTMEGFHVGKQASPVDYVKPVAMRAPAGRFAPLNRTDTDYQRRWVMPVDKELVQMVDSFDKLRTVEDPTSALNQNAAAAVNREWDDRIIAAAFGDAQISTTDGSTLSTETWASFGGKYEISDTFGAGGTSIGMTVDKLIEADRLFRHFHVTEAEMQPGNKTLVISSWQEAEMKKLVEFVSREFNDRPVLNNENGLDGGRFMGWNIVISERLNLSSNIRECIAFVKSGLYLGMWMDMENVVTRREDLSGRPYQLYTAMSSGATRLEPGRVLKIKCGGDLSGPDNI